MTIRVGVLAAWVAAFAVSMAGVAQAKPLPVTVEAGGWKSCWVGALTGTGSCGGLATADAGGTSIAEAFVTSEGDGTLASTGNSQALDRFYGRFTLSTPAKSVTVTATTHVDSASAAWTAGPLAQEGGSATGRVLLQNFLYESPIGCCDWGSGAPSVTVVSAASSGASEAVEGETHVLSYTIEPREGVHRLPAGEYTTLVRNYALVDLKSASGTVSAALDGVVSITAVSKG